MTWHIYIALLVTSMIANLLLGCAILVLDARSKLNRIYAIMALSLAHWALMKLGIAFSSAEDTAALFYRLSGLCWCFLPSLFVHFSLTFTGRRSSLFQRYLPHVAYAISTVLVVSLWIEGLMLGGMKAEEWGFADVPGPLYRLAFQPFLLLAFIYALYELASMVHRAEHRDQKARAALVFAGIFIPFSAGAVTDMILPSLGIYVFELAVPLTTINAAVIAFAIHRYRFLNITVEYIASTIIETMGDVLIVFDTNGKIRIVNPAAARLLGYRQDEIVGLMITDVLHNWSFESDLMSVLEAKGTDVREVEYITRTGTRIDASMSISPLRDNRGQTMGYVSVGKDIRRQKELITQIERASRELEELAVRDPLTELYNRRHLMVRLREELQRSRRYKHPFSVIMIDLDRFKEVNDSFGHEEGDKVLVLIAKAIRSQVRSTDTAARYGGDEFVIVFPMTPQDQAVARARRIKDSIAGEVLPEKYKFVTASLGISTFDPDDALVDEEELIRLADRALLVAKRSGKNRIVHITTINRGMAK